MFSNRTIEHRSEIEALKVERKLALQSFKQIGLIKNERLAEYFFYKFKEGKDVPFSLLKKIPVGEALLLPVVYGGAIVTTKEHTIRPNEVIYNTKWTSGSTLTMHYHSDCNEVITVLDGKVKVYVKGSTHILKVGDKIEVGYGIVHQITALVESELEIAFIKVI